MGTLLASALALSAFTSASIAAPLVLNDAQMDAFTAGQTSQSNSSQITQSNTSEVNVTQSNTSNVFMTADAPVDQSNLTVVSFTMSLTESGQSTLTYTTTQRN
jgi:hypothetical protein